DGRELPTRYRRSYFQRYRSNGKESDEAPGTSSKPIPGAQSESQSGTQPEPQSNLQSNPAMSNKFGAAWLKGEQKLRDDAANVRLLQKYNEILALDLDIDIDLESLEPAVRHTMLKQALEKKVQELEANRITLLIGC